MKQRHLLNGLLILVLAGMLVTVPAEAQPAQVKEIQIDGSTTVGPIADAFVEAFRKTHPGVKMTVKKTGSGDGAAALIDGRCQIATMSRFMKDKEFKKAVEKGVLPVAHAIAMDGVCVIVNPANPVNGLTTDKIQGIFTGKIKNWKELGGPDMAIVPVSRDTSSGTYETFHKLAMKKKKMGGNVEYANSNPQVHTRVSTTKGGIGYVGLGFVDNKVKAVAVDGVKPTQRTIAKGEFPLARPLYLFTNGYPKLGGMVHAFCTFYLTEPGQQIIEAKGFVPLTNY